MTKHIHIHLPPGARVTAVRSGDSGDWDESKHKRDDGGKFSSTGGGGASKAAQERADRQKQAEAANKSAAAEIKARMAAKRDTQSKQEALQARNDQIQREARQHLADIASGKTKPLPARTIGPHGVQIHNIHANAGGELLQVNVKTAEQVAWFRKLFPELNTSGEGYGAYTLREPKQAARLKDALKGGKSQPEAHAEGQEQVRAQAEANEKAMPKNSHVNVPGGGTALVLAHRGNMVLTNKGEFHATKLTPVAKGVSQARVDTTKGNHKPGWMLRADPELAAKFKAAEARLAERSAIAKQGPSAPAGGPDWSGSNGNWDKAKKEGRELVQAKLQEAKTGGDRTDALLALKKQAEVEHKKGSYLAAVVIGEVNDYFARVK